jgi:hypothetical protein
LGQYLQYGDFSAVMMKEQALIRDTKHILNLLEVELGKRGKALEWFLEKYDNV